MDDPLSTVRMRAALEENASGDGPEPIDVGPLAPYPTWLIVTLVVRAAQSIFVVCCLWYIAALFYAMGRPHSISLPPIWLVGATLLLGASDSRSRGRSRTSPVGDLIGNLLASQQCPACGQNVFDHTPPSGYAPPSQAEAIFPSRICTNCGHDLGERTAGS
jgi:hypothetical protein